MGTNPTNSNFAPNTAPNLNAQIGVGRTSGLETSGGASVQITTQLPGVKDSPGFQSAPQSSSRQASDLAFSTGQSRNNSKGGENVDHNA